MSDRLRSLQRILALQAQMKQVAEWKLATLERRKAALAVAQDELTAFVDEGDATGRLASLAIGQARRLASRATQIEEARSRQVDATFEVQRKHRLAEDRAAEALRDERDQSERKTLLELIEMQIGRPPDRG